MARAHEQWQLEDGPDRRVDAEQFAAPGGPNKTAEDAADADEAGDDDLDDDDLDDDEDDEFEDDEDSDAESDEDSEEETV